VRIIRTKTGESLVQVQRIVDTSVADAAVGADGDSDGSTDGSATSGTDSAADSGSDE
jgi:hypothetical protein